MLLNETLYLPLLRKINRCVCYLTNQSEQQNLEISDVIIVYNFYTYIHQSTNQNLMYCFFLRPRGGKKTEHMNVVCPCQTVAVIHHHENEEEDDGGDSKCYGNDDDCCNRKSHSKRKFV